MFWARFPTLPPPKSFRWDNPLPTGPCTTPTKEAPQALEDESNVIPRRQENQLPPTYYKDPPLQTNYAARTNLAPPTPPMKRAPPPSPPASAQGPDHGKTSIPPANHTDKKTKAPNPTGHT
ncbi:hypothetical protein E4T56_gene16917 [Termitomyces sp. T112]|nr:hypothetical protein E4T56_gene16917 [Termitomyces sp. T112]